MTRITAAEAATSTTPVTDWISADEEAEIDMTGRTAAEALVELFAQCSSDEERATILGGSFIIADRWEGETPQESAITDTMLRDPQEWADCPRGDRMLMLLGQEGADRRTLVLAACDCARLTLAYVPKWSRRRARRAIETAQAWARGEATLAEVRDAAYEADPEGAFDPEDHDSIAACAAAQAAAEAATDPDAAAEAVLEAADAVDFAEGRLAWERMMEACADVVRRHFPDPPHSVEAQ